MKSIKRFFQGSQQSFFLFGPRGTGKSTWVRRHMPEAFLIDLLVPDQLRFYSAKPERLRDVTEAQQSVRTIVIDEVQKAPALLDVVHSGRSDARLSRAGFFTACQASSGGTPEILFLRSGRFHGRPPGRASRSATGNRRGGPLSSPAPVRSLLAATRCGRSCSPNTAPDSQFFEFMSNSIGGMDSDAMVQACG